MRRSLKTFYYGFNVAVTATMISIWQFTYSVTEDNYGPMSDLNRSDFMEAALDLWAYALFSGLGILHLIFWVILLSVLTAYIESLCKGIIEKAENKTDS